MGACSLLWSFQKQALGSCHVFIFLNTPTGTPPWLTHTQKARGLEWLFFSLQLDNPAHGSQQGRQALGRCSCSPVDQTQTNPQELAVSPHPLSKFRIDKKISSASHLYFFSLRYKWERTVVTLNGTNTKKLEVISKSVESVLILEKWLSMSI